MYPSSFTVDLPLYIVSTVPLNETQEIIIDG